jgi:hypothetical protein
METSRTFDMSQPPYDLKHVRYTCIYSLTLILANLNFDQHKNGYKSEMINRDRIFYMFTGKKYSD